MSKSVLKNMLKACNLTKEELCHRCFDNNLENFPNKCS